MTSYTNSGFKMPFDATQQSGIFSRIKSAGGNLSRTTILLISSALLFAVIAGVYIFFYYIPSLKSSYKPNREHVTNGSSDSKTAEMLLFYADWCPHCKTAKPIWEEVKAQYENKIINGYQVVFTEVNCTSENAEVEQMMNKYNIEGFPTIKLLKDGQVIEYDAKPSKETLNQFLNTVL
jgi:thiol-disulfide isomerase/thioredoxin